MTELCDFRLISRGRSESPVPPNHKLDLDLLSLSPSSTSSKWGVAEEPKTPLLVMDSLSKPQCGEEALEVVSRKKECWGLYGCVCTFCNLKTWILLV